MNDRIALVTGASRGIGRAIALHLAQDGMMVAVHYHERREAAEEVVHRIERKGGKAFAVQGNVGEVSGVTDLFDQFDSAIKERTGGVGLDVLVNNAGICKSGTVEETSEGTFDDVFTVNAKGPFFMMQKAIPRMHEHGRIINISSCVTRLAYPDVAAYSAAKGAINVLTVLLASQLAPRGITVNAVAPGVTDTDMNACWLDNDIARRYIEETTAMGRVGRPQDITGVVSFLASPQSAWITGQYIEASGGIRL